MSKRVRALKRIFVLIYMYFVGIFLSTLVMFVGLIWMVLDVLWELFVGSEGLSDSGTAARWIKGTLTWNKDQYVYALTGDGEMALLPSPA